MRPALLSTSFVCLLLAGCASPPSSNADMERSAPAPTAVADPLPPGSLGFRLGTYLTIEGVRAEQGKVGANALIVDTVNGQKLDAPVTIEIENVHELPSATRCVLNGYESGRMIGLPYEVAEKEGMGLPQAVWQFRRYFIMTSVVRAAGLVIERPSQAHHPPPAPRETGANPDAPPTPAERSGLQ